MRRNLANNAGWNIILEDINAMLKLDLIRATYNGKNGGFRIIGSVDTITVTDILDDRMTVELTLNLQGFGSWHASVPIQLGDGPVDKDQAYRTHQELRLLGLETVEVNFDTPVGYLGFLSQIQHAAKHDTPIGLADMSQHHEFDTYIKIATEEKIIHVSDPDPGGASFIIVDDMGRLDRYVRELSSA